MIVHLLPLGRHRPEQGAACIDQIFSLQVFLTVYQEILLLRPHAGHDAVHCEITEQMENTLCLPVDRFH